jgi:glucose/mannose transport system permease protein
MPRIYRRIILPAIGPIFVAVLVVLLQSAIKIFDLVIALTGGGPGIATTVPSIYVYDLIFQRGQMAEGAAAAMMILFALSLVLVPYMIWSNWRQRREAGRA